MVENTMTLRDSSKAFAERVTRLVYYPAWLLFTTWCLSWLILGLMILLAAHEVIAEPGWFVAIERASRLIASVIEAGPGEAARLLDAAALLVSGLMLGQFLLNSGSQRRFETSVATLLLVASLASLVLVLAMPPAKDLPFLVASADLANHTVQILARNAALMLATVGAAIGHNLRGNT